MNSNEDYLDQLLNQMKNEDELPNVDAAQTEKGSQNEFVHNDEGLQTEDSGQNQETQNSGSYFKDVLAEMPGDSEESDNSEEIKNSEFDVDAFASQMEKEMADSQPQDEVDIELDSLLGDSENEDVSAIQDLLHKDEHHEMIEEPGPDMFENFDVMSAINGLDSEDSNSETSGKKKVKKERMKKEKVKKTPKEKTPKEKTPKEKTPKEKTNKEKTSNKKQITQKAPRENKLRGFFHKKGQEEPIEFTDDKAIDETGTLEGSHFDDIDRVLEESQEVISNETQENETNVSGLPGVIKDESETADLLNGTGDGADLFDLLNGTGEEATEADLLNGTEDGADISELLSSTGDAATEVDLLNGMGDGTDISDLFSGVGEGADISDLLNGTGDGADLLNGAGDGASEQQIEGLEEDYLQALLRDVGEEDEKEVRKDEKKEKTTKGKKKGLFAKLLDALTETEDEDSQEEESIILSEENQDILRNLEEKEEKVKGKRKKKGKDKTDSSGEGDTKEKKEKKEKKPKKKKAPKLSEVDLTPARKLSKRRVILIFLVCITACLVFLLLITVGIDISVKNTAIRAYQQGDYETCYENLKGKNLTDSQKVMYGKSESILRIRLWIREYEFFMERGEDANALDVLLLSVRDYPTLYQFSNQYNATDEVTENYNRILTWLDMEFGLDEDTAKKIAAVPEDVIYTKIVKAIVAGQDYQIFLDGNSNDNLTEDLSDYLSEEEEYNNDSNN